MWPDLFDITAEILDGLKESSEVQLLARKNESVHLGF